MALSVRVASKISLAGQIGHVTPSAAGAFGSPLRANAARLSIIAPDNRGSIGVARKNGLSLWKDTVFRGTPVHIFRITRDEWEEIQTMSR